MTSRELREVIEDAFLAGHAAGVGDRDDECIESAAAIPMGDCRVEHRKEIDDLVYEAGRKLGVKP